MTDQEILDTFTRILRDLLLDELDCPFDGNPTTRGSQLGFL